MCMQTQTYTFCGIKVLWLMKLLLTSYVSLSRRSRGRLSGQESFCGCECSCVCSVLSAVGVKWLHVCFIHPEHRLKVRTESLCSTFSSERLSHWKNMCGWDRSVHERNRGPRAFERKMGKNGDALPSFRTVVHFIPHASLPSTSHFLCLVPRGCRMSICIAVLCETTSQTHTRTSTTHKCSHGSSTVMERFSHIYIMKSSTQIWQDKTMQLWRDYVIMSPDL